METQDQIKASSLITGDLTTGDDGGVPTSIRFRDESPPGRERNEIDRDRLTTASGETHVTGATGGGTRETPLVPQHVHMTMVPQAKIGLRDMAKILRLSTHAQEINTEQLMRIRLMHDRVLDGESNYNNQKMASHHVSQVLSPTSTTSLS
jgi:hypothetical protein